MMRTRILDSSIVILWVMPFLLYVGSLSAATYSVPGSYATISEAHAVAGYGDTILVANGVYQESFTISKTVHFVASSGRPVIQFDGTTQQALPSWAGYEAVITSTYGPVPTFNGFEFNGINGSDTCTNFYYASYGTNFSDCIFHGSKGYLFRSNRSGSANDCDFYGPANYGWWAMWQSTVNNCRFRHIEGIGIRAGSDGVYKNNVLSECDRAIYSRATRDNVYSNNLIYHCQDGFYAAYLTGNFDPSLRPSFINNTFVLNRRHGIRISGKDGAILKNNIVIYNGLEDTASYFDLYVANNNKPGWDIIYNNIGRYSDSLTNIFADSINCIGNISADPLFADTAVGDTANGFYLLVNSPCIDAGNPGIHDPDSGRSDMGCYGGPEGKMKAPQWLRNLGSVVQTVGAPNDNLSWPQSGAADFHSYRIYHDFTTTDMHYQPSVANQVATVTTQTLTSGSYPHGADDTWYRVSVVGDSTGYLLGGGFTEADTSAPLLEKAYYYCNGTADPSDDELRLYFSEGINPNTINTLNPGNDFILSGVGSLTGAFVTSTNPLVIQIGATGNMAVHNRSWIRINTAASNIADFYGNKAVTPGDSIQIVTFNVFNTDNENSYESIKQAVTAASSDDFILVFDDGVYTESVSIDKDDLTIQADSIANPSIDMLDTEAYAFTVVADRASIVGFNITGATTAGIRVQSGASGVRVIGNACYDMPVGIQVDAGAAAAEVRSNVCHGNSITGITISGDGTVAANNVVRDNSSAGITAIADNVDIRNNVVWNNGGTDIMVAGISTRAINNITDGSISGTGTNNSIVSPINAGNVFVNAGGNDFRLVQSATQWGAGENGENIGAYEGNVTRSGDGDTYHYHSLNDAYAAAGTDEVLTARSGRYYESLKTVSGKGVTLQAATGSRPELHWDEWGIYYTNDYFMVGFTGSETININGFIIDQDNVNAPNDRHVYGHKTSALVAIQAGVLRNCEFRDCENSAEPFEASRSVYVSGEFSVLIDSCTFHNCGHLSFYGANTKDLKTVSNCVFDSGANGIQLDNSNYVRIERCSFDNARVYTNGGGRHQFYNNVFNGTSITASSDVSYDYSVSNIWRNNTIINPEGGMLVQGVGDTLVNNIIWGAGGGTSALGVANSGGTVVAFYNVISSSNIETIGAHNWNIVGTDPKFADSTNGDFYLLENSVCIDGGDLRIKDPDGGRSDIGAFGGPDASPAAPTCPDSLDVKYGMFGDTLTWSNQLPGDFAHYSIYANSIYTNFRPGLADRDQIVTNSSTQVAYVDHAAGVSNYYKVSVVDTAGYGSGYASNDTTPPEILSATYHSKGTRDVSDDELVLILSEWVGDKASAVFDSGFTLYGEGDFSTATVGTGVRVNDDTLVITGMAEMAARNRTWIGFKAGAVYDYAGVSCHAGSVLVETYNVTLDSAGDEYATISAAESNAIPWQTVRILDNGLYLGSVAIDAPGMTVTPDSGCMVTLDGQGANVLSVTSDNVVINGLRLTGGGDGINGSGAGLVVTNCIAHHNGGDGFELNATGALYNCNAYENSSGVRFTGAGTCVNVVASDNTCNYNLASGTVNRNNFSYNGAVADINLSGIGNVSGMNPMYETTDSTSAQFLMPGENSACANAGDSLPGVVNRDIRGQIRPQLEYWDAGAYETDYLGKWLDHFTVSYVTSDTTAGEMISVSVTAYDQFDSVFTAYSQDVRVTALGAVAGSSVVYSAIMDSGNGHGLIPNTGFSNGVATFGVGYTVAYDTIMIRILSPEDSAVTTGALVWQTGPLAEMSLRCDGSTDTVHDVFAGRGVPNSVEVHVFDTYGNRIKDYSGSVAFTSTDSTAELPVGLAIGESDTGALMVNGMTIVLKRAGLQALVATTGGITDSLLLAVRADSVLGDLVIEYMPDTVYAGDAFPQDVIVSAFDAYGNGIVDFAGTVGFSNDDASPYTYLPPDRVYTTADSGSYTYGRGFFRLISAGTRIVAIGSGGVSTACSVQVLPGTFDYIRIVSALDGNGSAVGNTDVSNLDSLLLVAAAYDSYGNYRSDTTVVWDMVDDNNLIPAAGSELPDTGAYYVFRSEVYDRNGYLHAYMPSNPFIADTTGLIQVVEDAGYVNHVPEISAVIESLYYADAMYIQTVTATDSDVVDSSYFRLIAGPAAMTISEFDGTVTWETEADDTGSVYIGIAVFDNDGASDTLGYNLRIAPSPFVDNGFNVLQVQRNIVQIRCSAEDHYTEHPRFVVYKDSSVLDTINSTTIIDSNVIAGTSYLYEAALLINGERESVHRQKAVVIDPIWVIYNNHSFAGIENTVNPGNMVDVGKKVKINVALENVGTQNALSVDAQLSSDDPYIDVVDSIGGYNNIGMGDTTVCYLPMSFVIDAECSGGHVARMYLDINDSWGSTWKDSFEIVIEPLGIDVFVVDDDNIPDSYGNDNSIPEADEIIELTPRLVNVWDVTVSNVVGELVSLNSNCLVDSNDAVWSYGTILPGATALPEFDYVFTMETGSDTGNIQLALKVTGDIVHSSYSERRSWLIPIYGTDMTSGIIYHRSPYVGQERSDVRFFDVNGNPVDATNRGIYFFREGEQLKKVLIVD